jgi:hypothetical protein
MSIINLATEKVADLATGKVADLATEKVADLRFRETGSSGRFDMAAVAASPGDAAVPSADAAVIATLRHEVGALRAEVVRLAGVVAVGIAEANIAEASLVDARRRDDGRCDDDRRQGVAAQTSATLRGPARSAPVTAISGDAAAPPRQEGLPQRDVATDAAASGPDWRKTDEALACLLSALARHADSERERLARRRAAAQLRLGEAIARGERERAAIKRYRRADSRANCWWTRVLRMTGAS